METLICPWKKEYYRVILQTLKKGGVVIYPTETSYGIGVDATNRKAVERVYALKRRDLTKPLLCITDSLSTISSYCSLTAQEKRLVNLLMPGPLTLVVQAKGTALKTTTQGTVSFRIPSSPVAWDLVHQYGTPLTSTSANVSGNEPLYQIASVIRRFFGIVDVIIDGGDLPKRKASTVAHIGNTIEILRTGPVSKKKILTALQR